MKNYDFTSKNLKEFCKINKVSEYEGIIAMLDECKRLFIELHKEKMEKDKN